MSRKEKIENKINNNAGACTSDAKVYKNQIPLTFGRVVNTEMLKLPMDRFIDKIIRECRD